MTKDAEAFIWMNYLIGCVMFYTELREHSVILSDHALLIQALFTSKKKSTVNIK